MNRFNTILLFIVLNGCSSNNLTEEKVKNPADYNNLVKITLLDDAVKESSGLVFLNDKLITHNDSGGANSLYQLDTLNGSISKTTTIKNSTNKDWEDIAVDSQYIYIGDFGNNNGNRKDLLIYKIKISDYLNSGNSSINNEEIKFSYSDQTIFNASPYNTNFDAEAIISLGNNLYIFTKNWVNKWTNIYSLEKNAGTYIASKIDSINVKGFITAADYDQSTNTISLLGYENNSNFLIELSEFKNSNFSAGTIKRYNLKVPQNSSVQTEGLSYLLNNYYISGEKNSGNSQILYKINRKNLLIN
jgi:hypothetical protein